jgi:hypothetical protein
MDEADLLKPALSAVGTVWHSFCMQHQVIWCVCSTKSFGIHSVCGTKSLV